MYLLTVRLDQAHSFFFGDYHYEFAMKAAEQGSHSESQDAFRRARVVSPSDFESGIMAIRPSGGMALSCWREAKATIDFNRSDDRKMNALWLVIQ